MFTNILDAQQDPSPVEGIKIQVECIDETVAMIIDDNGCTSSSIRLAGAVRLHTVEPGRIRRDVIDRCKVYLCAIESIQRVEIIKRQWGFIAIDDGKVDLGLGVEELRPNIRGEISIAGMEPYNGSCEALALPGCHEQSTL